MNNNFYNKNLKDFSRELRSEKSTRAEKLLWKSSLSKKQKAVEFSNLPAAVYQEEKKLKENQKH